MHHIISHQITAETWLGWKDEEHNAVGISMKAEALDPIVFEQSV